MYVTLLQNDRNKLLKSKKSGKCECECKWRMQVDPSDVVIRS